MSNRRVERRYSDPVDLIWLDAAERLGMRVERSAEVYASWDGNGTLTVGDADDLDADDSLAQLVFHEICHALVAGPERRTCPDWGLDNTGSRDLVFEHACHRVQAALAHPYGLRAFFAVTTEWRSYWDALPEDPLAPGDDPALPLARRALILAGESPFAEALREALSRTAQVADAVRAIAPDSSLWRLTRTRHVSGFLGHSDPSLRCGDCAWFYRQGRVFGCRQALRKGRPEVRLDKRTAACENWEAQLDADSCASCGACCRQGFDRVELRRRDVLEKKHPELVAVDRFGVYVPRPGGHCVALQGNAVDGPYRCSVYVDRPKACSDFEISGDACLMARRRVGLSR